MITLPNFDTDFKGKTFTDTTLGSELQYTCCGYGDNQGNPYLVGVAASKTLGRAIVRTVLLKHVEFSDPKP